MANESYSLKYTGQEIDKKLDQVSSLEDSFEELDSIRLPEVDNKINRINIDVSSFDNRITGVESGLQEAQSHIGTLETRVINNLAMINGHEDELSAIRSALNNKVDNNIYNSKVSSLERTIQDNYNDLFQSLNSTSIGLSGKIDSNTTSIAVNSQDISSLNEKVDNINVDLNGLPDRIVQLENSWASYEGEISSLKGNVETNTNAIGILNSSFDSYREQITQDISSKVEQTDFNRFQEEYNRQITSLESTIEELQSTIGDLQATITDLQERITKLEMVQS